MFCKDLCNDCGYEVIIRIVFSCTVKTQSEQEVMEMCRVMQCKILRYGECNRRLSLWCSTVCSSRYVPTLQNPGEGQSANSVKIYQRHRIQIDRNSS